MSILSPRSKSIPNLETLTGQNDLNERTYAALISLFLLLGVALALGGIALVAYLDLIFWPITLGLIGAWAGLEITARTVDWRTSLLGHALASLSLGLGAGPLLLLPGAHWLRTATAIAGAGTILLSGVSLLWPALVKAFGSSLLIWGIVVGAFHLLPTQWAHIQPPGIASMILSLIFLGFTDRYWTRTMQLPRNIDNAVDSACAIYAHALHSILSLLDSHAKPLNETRSSVWRHR